MDKHSRRRILLVDDDTSLLVTLSDFLRFEGYEVITAESGEQGLERLVDMTPDLIILDMSMPGMGGVGFLRKIASADGKLKHPVLVLTARANMAEFFANVDVDGFVAKPCDPHDLLMEVGRIVFLRSGAVAEEGAAAPSAKRKVLIGEDSAAVSHTLARALAAEGYVVDCVAKGPDVIEKAIMGRPDVIVMKRILANMNGDAVAGMLKEMSNTRDIPVVLYDDSGVETAQSRFTGANSNIKQFILSSQPPSVLQAVREALAES